MRRSIFVAGFVIAGGWALLAPVLAQDDQVYEQNVTHFDGGGEPAIAYDPTNPQRLAAIVMQTGLISEGGADGPRCAVFRSSDGGQTWQGGEPFPIYDAVNNSCEDPNIAWLPDGTLIGGGHAYQGLNLQINHWRVLRSTDGGVTWSPYTELMANDRVTEDFDGNPQVARPLRGWTFADESPGSRTVYAEMPFAGTTSGQALFVSTDSGLTWTTRPRHIGPDTQQDAAHGVIATLFAGTVPTDPTTGFSMSTDDGQTWSAGKPVPAAGFLRADPSRPGRYAIMQETTSSMNVWVTEDSGDTWSGPVQLAEQSEATNTQRNKPWIDYGPTGVLAVMWKTKYPDLAPSGGEASQNGVFDTWAAISRDGGHTFDTPLRVSSALSGAPTGEALQCWSLPVCGDDFSYLAVDAGNVHIVWGDNRTSATDPTPVHRSMYYARLPEPGGALPLAAGVALLFGLRRGRPWLRSGPRAVTRG